MWYYMPMIKRAFDSVRSVWDTLGRSIYVGRRYESNMHALTFVSGVTAVLGLILIITDITTRNIPLLVASVLTCLAGLGCGFFSHVKKNRDIAILFPTFFCAIFITIYFFTAAGEGSAMLWSLLIPIGMCYFVSVKYGIVLSGYYTLLIAIIFYTPLNAKFCMYYSPMFMTRFPILYACVSIFTGMAMIQYHRTALFEIDHANRLTEEVERQTAVVKEQSRKIEQMSL